MAVSQVGYSGGGKTTIAALLSRFYTPTQGNIEIDGFDVVDLDRRWLRQKMALVGQNPALFTGCVWYLRVHVCVARAFLRRRA